MENRLNESAMLRMCSTVGSVMLDEPAILTVFGGTSSSPKAGLIVIIFFRSVLLNKCSRFSKSLMDSAKAGLVDVFEENDRRPVIGPVLNRPHIFMTRWIWFFLLRKALRTALPPALVPTRETRHPCCERVSINVNKPSSFG